MNGTNSDIKITADEIKKIASKKIYFGHMSVGYNILDGLKDILPADSKIDIQETSNPKDFTKPLFAHSQNGENTKPETKIEAFVKKMDAGLGNKVDIAFFKFCYVDISATTDVIKLFDEYKKTMDGLIKKYPKTKFIHITVPVTTEEEGLKVKFKSIIKSLIGRKTGFEFDNIKRMEFNTLLKKQYGTKLFDLAKYESSSDSGEELLSDKGGIKHYSLRKDFTNDGGHLNQKGVKITATYFIKFLSQQ